jgi:hypothetical protein
MANALFSYEDVGAAQRAARRVATKLSPKAVVLHAKDYPPNDNLVDEVDEQVSGGLLRNFYDLWKGVFEWGSSPHEASDYEETVRNGGAVVSVDADTVEDQKMVDHIMRETGFKQRTDWKAPVAAGS